MGADAPTGRPPSVPIVTVLLALLSSLLWGTSDFLGGTAAKRLPVLVVVGVSQAVALVALVPVAVLLGAAPGSLVQGVAAGVAGVIGLGAFYAALATGTMGVVAPIASLGALLPVAVGLSRGESPSVLQLAGIVVAVGGVVLASGPELTGRAPLRPLLLAVTAAFGFGAVAVLLADGSAAAPGAVLVTLLVMRVTSVGLLVVVLLAARTAVRPGRGNLPLLVAIGLGDVAANAAYAFASRGGLLSVVSVLASLYPVVTVLLARQVLSERLMPVQAFGAVATLAGVGLLAAG